MTCFSAQQNPKDLLETPIDEHESIDMHTAMTSVGNVLEVGVSLYLSFLS